MILSDKIKRLFDRNSPKARVAQQELSGQVFLTPLCSTYENIFPQIRPLIDALKDVRPFGVGRNGATLPLARTPELNQLENPNEEMGEAEFLDLAFAIWLTESELNIHVWKNERGTVFGYTILPPHSKVANGSGDYYYQIKQADGSIMNLSKDEVMSLRYSRSPSNIQQGVSPAQTVFVQTQIMDLMYQYERAFLENGAVPAYITIIRASTKEKFEETKRDLEGGFKGANNKGKTLYLWRQFLDDGSERDQVEVKTIQPNNSTLAIKEIMSIVKDDLNKAFGVSEFILGNDSSAKYDNAELSQQQFMLRRVKPALRSFWSQFQHELDRILPRGLPYAISWTLDIPELTDRIKVKAEISEKNVANLRNLIVAGAAPKAAVEALNLDDKWLDVAFGIFAEKQRQNELAQTTPALAISQNPDKIPTLSPLLESKDPDKIPRKTGQDSTNSTYVIEERQHTCGAECNHTQDATERVTPTFSEGEAVERLIYEKLSELLDSAIAEATGDGTVLSEQQITEIRDQIVEQLVAQADLGANEGAKQIKPQIAVAFGNEIAKVLKNGGFHVSSNFQKRLQKRTDELVSRLSKEAQEVARKALDPLQEEGMSASQIKTELSKVMPKARAATIARNETVYAFRAGHLENDKALAQKYHLTLKKVWRCHHDGATCAVCEAMDGQTVDITEAFADSVEGRDGIAYSWEHTSWNDDGEIPSAHVNCRCYFETEVVYE